MKAYATSGSVPKYRIGVCAIGFADALGMSEAQHFRGKLVLRVR